MGRVSGCKRQHRLLLHQFWFGEKIKTRGLGSAGGGPGEGLNKGPIRGKERDQLCYTILRAKPLSTSTSSKTSGMSRESALRIIGIRSVAEAFGDEPPRGESKTPVSSGKLGHNPPSWQLSSTHRPVKRTRAMTQDLKK